MIDNIINKTELCEKAKITINAMDKLGKNESVPVETSIKICKILDCRLDEIINY